MSLPKPLSKRRKITTSKKWKNTRELLKQNSFESFCNENKPSTSKAKSSTFSSPSRLAMRDSYEISKRAFIVEQNRRYKHCQKTEQIIYDSETAAHKQQTKLKMKQIPERATKLNRAPLRDNHIIEDVIAQRNKEYLQTSPFIPEGYVLDITATRNLPPDRHTTPKRSSRTFYWG